MRSLLVILLLFVAGCTPDDHAEHAASTESHAEHTTLPPPAEPALGAMSLYQLDTPWTDHTGSEQVLASLSGTPALIAMTYTSCQVSCPVILADLKRIERRLDEDNEDVRILLLSLDPVRDTAETLAAFKQEKNLSDRWVLMRAPDDQVREMAALLGVSYRRTPDGEVSHSNIISILDVEGVLIHQQLGLGAGKPEETARVLLEGNHQ